MQARVRAIHVSPVKSLRLSTLDEAMLTGRGIPGDRAFVLVRPDDERAPFLTMRRAGRLARAVAVYDPISGRLSITIDGQQPLTGEPGRGPAHSLQMWGRDVTGYLVDGPWAAALSELVGRDVELMEVDDRSHGQDAYPVSLLSIESCTELGDRNGRGAPDPRRFRPSILIEGAGPHAEDGWIGEHLRVGEAVVRVAEKDTRCVLTTLNPDTGERDLDTLRMIAAYRPPEDSEVCFGVYADVVQEGRVRVGDPIAPRRRPMTVLRCPWAGDDDLMVAYHDDEWGVPQHDSRRLFELLLLEGFQAGLSWRTILHKRARYREVLDGFDPQRIAGYGEAKLADLMADPGIVRNRLKIAGAVRNAQAYLRLTEQEGDFAAWIWGFVDGRPQLPSQPRTMANLPASTPASDGLSRALRKRGFTFVGSTICYAFMQAAGLVDDHVVGCYRYRGPVAG